MKTLFTFAALLMAIFTAGALAEVNGQNNSALIKKSQSSITAKFPNDLTGWMSFNSSKDGTAGLSYHPQEIFRYSDNEFVAVVNFTSTKPIDEAGAVSMFYLVIGDCATKKWAYKYMERFNTSGVLLSKSGDVEYVAPSVDLKSTDAFPPLFNIACGRLGSLPPLSKFSNLSR